MGQVYQATDTTLNRQVALKILPEAFASDPDRRARARSDALENFQALCWLCNTNKGAGDDTDLRTVRMGDVPVAVEI